MYKQLLKDTLFWGFVLWLFGYILGILLFMLVPSDLIGWIISPFGIAMTVWVLLRKIKSIQLQYYIVVGIIWTIIAILFDYIFLLQLLKPADGYYKLDVYFYYLFTFILPTFAGWLKKPKTNLRK